MDAERRYGFDITHTVVIALSYDDAVMLKELGHKVVVIDKRRACYTTTLEGLWTVLYDVNDRCEWVQPVWDQPKSWRAACRRYVGELAAQVLRQKPPADSPVAKLATEIATYGRGFSTLRRIADSSR